MHTKNRNKCFIHYNISMYIQTQLFFGLWNPDLNRRDSTFQPRFSCPP